jgi:hypothetical protein
MSTQQQPEEIRTNCGGFDHVSNCESFDRLVLGSTSRAVGTADGLNVASTFLVSATATISALNIAPRSDKEKQTWTLVF